MAASVGDYLFRVHTNVTAQVVTGVAISVTSGYLIEKAALSLKALRVQPG